MSASDVNVLLIRAFEGPRHARLEKIWDEVAKRAPIKLRIFDNLGAKLRHAQCLAAMWEQEIWRPEHECIITEFDFLPYDGFWYGDRRAEIESTMYCTRDPATLRLSVEPRIAGGWFTHIRKTDAVLQRRHVILRGLSEESGRYRDPCNALLPDRFLPLVDAYPEHYGCRVVGRGEHLFWSRHYNDPPYLTLGGFSLASIHRKVDRTITRYEETLRRTSTLPQAPAAPPIDRPADRGDVSA